MQISTRKVTAKALLALSLALVACDSGPSVEDYDDPPELYFPDLHVEPDTDPEPIPGLPLPPSTQPTLERAIEMLGGTWRVTGFQNPVFGKLDFEYTLTDFKELERGAYTFEGTYTAKATERPYEGRVIGVLRLTPLGDYSYTIADGRQWFELVERRRSAIPGYRSESSHLFVSVFQRVLLPRARRSG